MLRGKVVFSRLYLHVRVLIELPIRNAYLFHRSREKKRSPNSFPMHSCHAQYYAVHRGFQFTNASVQSHLYKT